MNFPQAWYAPSTFPPSMLHYVVESPRPESPATSSCSSQSGGKRWEVTKVKSLIQAFKENRERLTNARSNQAKKSVWSAIFTKHRRLCEEGGINTEKSLSQVKEKWRAPFDKYKSVCDNNKRTGRGRETFQFFEEIDEFMSCSDKVNPRFVKQTGVVPAHDQDAAEMGGGQQGEEHADVGEGGVEGRQDEGAARKRPAECEERRRKKRKRTSGEGLAETEASLVSVLESQREEMAKAEERDSKVLETMMKFEVDAEKRHQEFMTSVLGKLGDIFSAKK